MKKTIFIIAGGEIGSPDFLKDQLAQADFGDIVCADSGARHLYAIGKIPAVIIGDLDSLAPEIIYYFEKKNCLIIRHSEKKDKTDTELAIDYAFALEPTSVKLFGAMGGRLDHTLANISLLVLGAKRGIEITMIDEWCEVFLVTGRKMVNGEAGQTVSLFPVSSEVNGITLTGFEYPLADAVMEHGHPYGISNRLAAEQGMISVNSGHLLGIRYFQPGVFPGGK